MVGHVIDMISYLLDETKESSVRAAMEMVMQLMTFRRGGNGLIA